MTRHFRLPINGLDDVVAEPAPIRWNGFPMPLVTHPIAVQIAMAVGDPIPMLYLGAQPYGGLQWELLDCFHDVAAGVVDALAAVGLVATVEYPGWICVRTSDGEWNFGTANGVWDGDLMTGDGTEHLRSVRFDIDPASTDAAMIAFAIYQAVRPPVTSVESQSYIDGGVPELLALRKGVARG